MHAHARLSRGVLVLALAAGLLALPSPASAHNGLVGTDPADGANAEAVTEVQLEFAEPVLAAGAFVDVFSNDGVSHAVGEPEIRRDRFVVQQVGALPPGEYVVAWRVVGEDGHPISGAFRFRVESGPETPMPGGKPTMSESHSPAPNIPAGSQPVLDTDEPGGSLTIGWQAVLVPAAIGAMLVLRVLLPRLRK